MEAPGLSPDDIRAFAQSVTGGVGSQVTHLAGQASSRRYHRVSTGGSPPSVVIMELPHEDWATPADDHPFLNMHRFLARHHYPVPQVYKASLPTGMIALEDLGDHTLEQAVNSDGRSESTIRRLYGQAIELIGPLQDMGKNPDPSCVAFGRRFDFKLLRWELEHFVQWLLVEDRRGDLEESERALVAHAFDQIAQELAEASTVLVHRDFQSRNLMAVANAGKADLRVIDFQDALFGSPVYDLVALLRDSYVALPDAQVHDFIAYFCALRGIEVAATTRLFHLQTIQRKLKDAGRFIFIDRKKGNPSFLSNVPQTLTYVRQAFGRLPELRSLQETLGKFVPELAT